MTPFEIRNEKFGPHVVEALKEGISTLIIAPPRSRH